MQKSAAFLSLAAFVLAGSVLSAQTSMTGPRQPIAVTSGFFSSLRATPRHTASNKLSAVTNAATKAHDPRIISVPTFTRSFSYHGSTYPYTMVGHDPSEKRTTTVPTNYVPLSFYFDDYVDSKGNNIVIDATTINREIKRSPLFDTTDYTTGNTQFVDAAMRAEFWPLFNKDGDNDGDDSFHVLLGDPQTLIPVTIEVPRGSSQVYVLPDGTYFALIDVDFLASQLNTLLQTEPVTPTSIPIFLTRNAVYGDFAQGQAVDCCIGGFHTAYEAGQKNNKIFVQAVAFATSLDPQVSDTIFGDSGIFADINALSHELAETLNDPFVNNVTPAYQLPGAPAGTCQNDLEVADVTENLTPEYSSMTLHGFTYHPQTVALLQWFEGRKHSDAINGDYSFPDSTLLKSAFQPCPAP